MKKSFVLACLVLFIHTLCFGDLFIESFESGFALSGWDTSKGDVGWQFNSDIASDGSKSLSTDTSIQTGQTAILEIVVETNRVKFDFTGVLSSGDIAYFYVNDELGRQITSANNWTTHTQNLEFGLHTFKWVFEYNSGFSNRFFAVDNIRFGNEFIGNGTKTSPYLIHNVGELNKIALEPDYQFYKNKHFRLNNNISLYDYGHVSGEPDSVSFEYNIIGRSVNDPFLGSFDGNGYAITDFKYHSNTSPNDSNIGFFGYLGESAVVENLSVEGFDYYGRYTIGGIAAVNNGTIRNCSAQGIITAYGQYGNAAGGITALNSGLIQNCQVDIQIVSDYGRVGGIAAQNLGGRIIDCTATNDIVANNQNVSGIAENAATATRGAVISGCIAINNRLESTGSSSNGMNVGGISSQNPEFCTIVNCQSSGVVKGNQNIGGLVGKNSGLVLASRSSAQVVYGYGNAGGAIGDNETTAVVRYSYATGNVGNIGGNGGYATGGFCGTARGLFRHCFSAGEVETGSSSSLTFGFAYPSGAEIIGCFFDRTKAGVGAHLTNTTENPNRDAYPLYSVSGEMTQQEKFEEKGWDFGYVWKIGSQSPELRAIWHYAFVYRDNPILIDEFELQGLTDEWLMDRSRDNHTQVTADYNKDGVVDLLDWAALANLWTARNQHN